MPMYCQINDVQRLIQWTRFQYSNVLDPNDIEEFIHEAEAEINGRLSQIYEVPIPEEDRRLVKFSATRISAYNVAKVLVAQAGGDLPETVARWYDDAQERIDQILNGKIVLENTPQKGDKITRSGLSSTMKDSEPYWKRGVDQW